VASGIGIALVRWPVLTDWLPADAQQAISIAIATTVVGLWSHAAKKIDG
jgi:hypothetical protein